MNEVGVWITEYLYVDMTGVADVFFHVKRIVAERGPRFGGGGAKRIFDFASTRHQLDATPAAARGGFQQQRIADLVGELCGFVRIFGMIGAWNERYTGGAGNFAGFELIAHLHDIFGAWTDEGDAIFGARLRQAGPLRKKTIARMKRVTAGALSGGNQVLDFQIAVGRAGRY